MEEVVPVSTHTSENNYSCKATKIFIEIFDIAGGVCRRVGFSKENWLRNGTAVVGCVCGIRFIAQGIIPHSHYIQHSNTLFCAPFN